MSDTFLNARRHAEAEAMRCAAGSPPTEAEVERMAVRALRKAEAATPRRMSGPRLVGVAIAGAALAAVLVAPALLPGRPGGPVPGAQVSSAYAAVKAAAAKTAALTSGTIRVKMVPDTDRPKRTFPGRPRPEIENPETVFKWNGDDYEVTGLRNVRYVDGQFYAERRNLDDDGPEGWVKAELDLSEKGGPQDWGRDAKAAYSPGALAGIAEELGGLTAKPGEGGSTVYSGTASAKAIGEKMGHNNLVGLPIWDGMSTSTPVKVEITVGGDGILRSWNAAYDFEDHRTVFAAELSDLGTTPPIETPPGPYLEPTGRK